MESKVGFGEGFLLVFVRYMVIVWGFEVLGLDWGFYMFVLRL